MKRSKLTLAIYFCGGLFAIGLLADLINGLDPFRAHGGSVGKGLVTAMVLLPAFWLWDVIAKRRKPRGPAR